MGAGLRQSLPGCAGWEVCVLGGRTGAAAARSAPLRERRGGGGGCGGGSRGERGGGAGRGARSPFGAGGAAAAGAGPGSCEEHGQRSPEPAARDMAKAGRAGEGRAGGPGWGSGRRVGGNGAGVGLAPLAQVGGGSGVAGAGGGAAGPPGAWRGPGPRPSCAPGHLVGHRVPLAVAPLERARSAAPLSSPAALGRPRSGHQSGCPAAAAPSHAPQREPGRAP